MRKLFSQLVGLPVYSAHSNSPVSLVRDIVIDPETGKVIAFLVSKNRIIVPIDIERMNTGLHIADSDRILPVADVLRVKEVFDRQIMLFGARVFQGKVKEPIGRVVDFEIDTEIMSLVHITVAKVLLFLHFQERIFPAKNIIRIERDKVVVRLKPEVPVREAVASRSEAFA